MHRTICIVSLLCLSLLASHAAAQTTGRARQAPTVILPDLNFTNVALEDAIEFLRDVSNANIHVNWRALEEVGVSRDATINLRLRRVSIGKVLSLMLAEAGGSDLLTHYDSDGIIHVTTRELADRDMITFVYPIEDLVMEIPDFIAPSFDLAMSGGGGRGGGGARGGGGTGGGGLFTQQEERENIRTKQQRGEELVELIVSTVQPDIWDVNGGRAAIRYFNGSLVVTAPRSVHESMGY